MPEVIGRNGVEFHARAIDQPHQVFGLGHHWDRKNIMCSCERKSDPTFNEAQGHQLRTGAYRFLQIEGAHADYARLGR